MKSAKDIIGGRNSSLYLIFYFFKKSSFGSQPFCRWTNATHYFFSNFKIRNRSLDGNLLQGIFHVENHVDYYRKTVII